MGQFIHSTSGRLMSFSITTALIGGGVSAFMAPPTSLYVMVFSSFVAITGCIASLQLGIEDHPKTTILSIILLPILLYLYAIGLFFVMKHYTEGAYGILALGACSLLVALRSLGGEKETSDSKARELPSSAHSTH